MFLFSLILFLPRLSMNAVKEKVFRNYILRNYFQNNVITYHLVVIVELEKEEGGTLYHLAN
jgi:hypothetical protein